ncbi:6347_t:CDS:2, partial [Ambispora leptoticha]
MSSTLEFVSSSSEIREIYVEDDEEFIPILTNLDKSAKLDWDVRSGVVVNHVLVFFWQDNGLVTLATTIHGIVGDKWEVERERRRPRETSTNAVKVRTVFGSESKKNLKIPKVIDDYNNCMNGMDIAHLLVELTL